MWIFHWPNPLGFNGITRIARPLSLYWESRTRTGTEWREDTGPTEQAGDATEDPERGKELTQDHRLLTYHGARLGPYREDVGVYR